MTNTAAHQASEKEQDKDGKKTENRTSLYEFKEKDGRSYYYDPATNTASWNVPPELIGKQFDADTEEDVEAEEERAADAESITSKESKHTVRLGSSVEIDVNDLDRSPLDVYLEVFPDRVDQALELALKVRHKIVAHRKLLVKIAFVCLVWWVSTTTAAMTRVSSGPSLDILRRVEASIADKFGSDAIALPIIRSPANLSSSFSEDDEDILERIQKSMLQVEQESCPGSSDKNNPLSFLNLGRRGPLQADK